MRKSGSFVLRRGAVLLSGELLLLPFCRSFWTLLIALGLVLPAGTAALAFGGGLPISVILGYGSGAGFVYLPGFSVTLFAKTTLDLL